MGICIGLLKKGRTDEQVAEHMLRHSPDLEVRKGKHVAEYVSRTIANARRIIGFA